MPRGGSFDHCTESFARTAAKNRRLDTGLFPARPRQSRGAPRVLPKDLCAPDASAALDAVEAGVSGPTFVRPDPSFAAVLVTFSSRSPCSLTSSSKCQQGVSGTSMAELL